MGTFDQRFFSMHKIMAPQVLVWKMYRSVLAGLLLLVSSFSHASGPLYYSPTVDPHRPFYPTASEACDSVLPGSKPHIAYDCGTNTCGSIGSCSVLSSSGDWVFGGYWLSGMHCPDNTQFYDDIKDCAGTVLVSEESKSVGRESCCVGNPINPGNGNKWQQELDYAGVVSTGGLSIIRTYNSSPSMPRAAEKHTFGARWTSRYDAAIINEPDRVPGQTLYQCWRRTDKDYVWCGYSGTETYTLNTVSLLRDDGKRSYFDRGPDINTWSPDPDRSDRLTSLRNSDGNITGWIHVEAQSDETEHFDANGRLQSIIARSGTTERLTYSDGTTNDTTVGRVPADAPACDRVHPGPVLSRGKLLCVSDSSGRQLQFEYDQLERVVKVIDPAGQEYIYEYDGPSGGCITAGSDEPACKANNLTKITFPDGKSKTYHYNEAAFINGGVLCPNQKDQGNGLGNLPNHLTGITDENSSRFATWTYDCRGRATSSQHPGGVEKVTLAFSDPDANGVSATTIQHLLGDPANPYIKASTLTFQRVQGVAKNQNISSPCVECGTIKSRVYDDHGNTISLTDWSDNKACFAYDLTRNLVTTRVDGLKSDADCATQLSATTLTSPARKITTQWHATYRLPTMIAEPNRLTTYTYDEKGNLLSKQEQATSDLTGAQGFAATTSGAARTWRYTYNNAGLVLTATDPRSNVTTYSYDSQSNLVSVTNAVGHVTSFSNYDAHGRPGRITSPNGIVTDLAYSPRGWLLSRTITAANATETTIFEYDGVGQLTKATLPDGTFLIYTYDNAHRLIRIADSLGNSVNYTLDLRGNRTSESVRDNGNTLQRQITRVYDALSRMTSITGGVQ